LELGEGVTYCTLVSITVDFRTSPVVNGPKGIHAMLPKSFSGEQRYMARASPESSANRCMHPKGAPSIQPEGREARGHRTFFLQAADARWRRWKISFHWQQEEPITVGRAMMGKIANNVDRNEIRTEEQCSYFSWLENHLEQFIGVEGTAGASIRYARVPRADRCLDGIDPSRTAVPSALM